MLKLICCYYPFIFRFIALQKYQKIVKHIIIIIFWVRYQITLNYVNREISFSGLMSNKFVKHCIWRMWSSFSQHSSTNPGWLQLGNKQDLRMCEQYILDADKTNVGPVDSGCRRYPYILDI